MNHFASSLLSQAVNRSGDLRPQLSSRMLQINIVPAPFGLYQSTLQTPTALNEIQSAATINQIKWNASVSQTENLPTETADHTVLRSTDKYVDQSVAAVKRLAVKEQKATRKENIIASETIKPANLIHPVNRSAPAQAKSKDYPLQEEKNEILENDNVSQIDKKRFHSLLSSKSVQIAKSAVLQEKLFHTVKEEVKQSVTPVLPKAREQPTAIKPVQNFLADKTASVSNRNLERNLAASKPVIVQAVQPAFKLLPANQVKQSHKSSADQDIHVSIGRLEIRAQWPDSKMAGAKSAKKPPFRFSLRDHLKQTSGKYYE